MIASSIKALNAFGTIAGPTIGVAVEAGQTGVKIVKDKKQRDAGHMPRSAYKEHVTKNVTRAVHSVAGGIVGSVVGEFVIPVPIVGAIAGGMVGGLIGDAIGSANGSVLGRAVDVINSAVQCTKMSKEEAKSKLSRKQNGHDNTRYFIYRSSKEGDPEVLDEVEDVREIAKAIEHEEVDVYYAEVRDQ
ncbi:hypothetical protein ACOME3_002939 [Neoechinorhynchus agilis]